MLKKFLVISVLSCASLLFSDSITDLVKTDVSPLTVENAQAETSGVSFKPFNVNTEKCEIEFNGDLEAVTNEFQEQLKQIWENIKGDTQYFAQQLKNKALQEAIIKIPTYIEFMMQKQTPELMSKIAEELSSCVDKTVSKGAQMDLGGGSGDQMGTIKAGVKPKELLGVVECYQEAFYPSNMTADDVILLNQIEEKWKKTIGALLYGQLNIVLKNFTVERNNNVCTNIKEKKEEDLAYLVDMLENQKVVFLNNKVVESSVNFEVSETEDKSLGVKVKEDVAEVTQIKVKKDKIATQAMFVDMEPASFEVFKEDVKAYMIKLARSFEYSLNEETLFFLQNMIVWQIFEDGKEDLSYDFHPLLITLAKSPEFFYDRYVKSPNLSASMAKTPDFGFGSLSFLQGRALGHKPSPKEAARLSYEAMKPLIVKEILNKTLLYVYTKGEYIREQKMELYNANSWQFVQSPNTILLQLLLLDRYRFRYKEKVHNAIINNLATKKQIERELFFRDFCMKNESKIYDDLCGRR